MPLHCIKRRKSEPSANNIAATHPFSVTEARAMALRCILLLALCRSRSRCGALAKRRNPNTVNAFPYQSAVQSTIPVSDRIPFKQLKLMRGYANYLNI